MNEITDLSETNEPYKLGSHHLEAIYHCSIDKYTTAELEHIYIWATQLSEGWHIHHRNGLLFIENPPDDICPSSTWHTYLDIVARPEWSELHPKLRKSKIIVRYVNELVDDKVSTEVGGDMMCLKKDDNELYIVRLSLYPKGAKIDVGNLLFKLIHEIAEEDFWQKTTPKEKHDLKDLEETDEAMLMREDYPMLLDESIANRRAVRALRRLWSSLNGKGLYGDSIDRVS